MFLFTTLIMYEALRHYIRCDINISNEAKTDVLSNNRYDLMYVQAWDIYVNENTYLTHT